MTWKPNRYTSVSPYLIVPDLEGALTWAEKALGAERLRVVEGTHGEVRIDDSVVMYGEMPENEGAHVHVYVPDVDDVFERALAHGGTLVQEPMEKGDGDRRGGIRDPFGTTWWLSTQQE